MKTVVTYWTNLLDTSGETVHLDWEELFTRFSVQRPYQGDKEHPGWSAARLVEPPQRADENVLELTALVLDYDGTESIEAATQLWKEYLGLLHTTRKHTAEAPRFRVILPLSRPVTPEEYAKLWFRVDARALYKLDPSTKNASRFWFVPGTKSGGEFVAIRFAGAPLDPDVLLALPDPRPRPIAAPPPPRPRTPPATPTDDAQRREHRASSYVAKMPPGITGQGGHAATWAVALAAAQGFGLDEDATYRILCEFNARCEPPWTERDLRHKARDACEKARVPSGYKLVDDDRYARYESPPDHYWDGPDGPPPEPLAPEEDDLERAAIVGEGAAAATDGKPKQTAAERCGAQSLADLFDAVVKRAETNKIDIGVTTGNCHLDGALGGLRRKRNTILGAETSFGKSSFAIMVADEVMRSKQNVLIVSGEDGPETYGQRFMARRARVNAIKIRDNDLLQVDIDKMKVQAALAEKQPFFLDGIGRHAEQLAAAVEAMCKENDIALVIVDYAQAFTCSKRCQDRRTEVTHIARTFGDAIKRANAAGLLLSQLKRPENSNRAPSMHDLKESGDLENMAEHVLLGHLEVSEPSPGVRSERHWFYLAKNKDGGRNIDRVHIPFDTLTASFRTVTDETVEKYPPAPVSYDYGEFEDR